MLCLRTSVADQPQGKQACRRPWPDRQCAVRLEYRVADRACDLQTIGAMWRSRTSKVDTICCASTPSPFLSCPCQRRCWCAPSTFSQSAGEPNSVGARSLLQGAQCV